MKRPRSYGEDLDDSIGDKESSKDWGRRDQDVERSSSHRRFYPKSENGRKGSSSAAYDRPLDDDRDVSRASRKRLEHDSEGFERRKSFDRYRDCSERMASVSSPRNIYGSERIHRSESFSSSRRDFPKGFRSERNRSRREEGVSSWRRLSGNKDSDEDLRCGFDTVKRVGSEDKGPARSPPVLKDNVKSPQWSRGLHRERSKSLETKKSEETHGDSGNSSEMEEGELEPEPKTEPEPESKSILESHVKMDAEECKLKIEGNVGSKLTSEKEMEELGKEDGQVNLENVKDKEDAFDETEDDNETAETLADIVKEIDKVLDEVNSPRNDLGGKEEMVCAKENEKNNEEIVEENAYLPSSKKEVVIEDTRVEKSSSLEEKPKENMGIDLEIKAEEIDFSGTHKEHVDEKKNPEETMEYMTAKLNENVVKDKGKSLAVPYEGNSTDNGGWMPRNLMASTKDPMEGPSNRGFELFFPSDATIAEKVQNSGLSKIRDEKLKAEPLDLSLSLPNVSIALSSNDYSKQAPNSPSHGRSFQSLPTTSFRTNSDGFTASISFSGSQTLVHNPSCSLTHNSYENYEHSVGSHPIFQGVDQISQGSWQGQSSNDPKRKEVSLYQRILQNGNVAGHTSNASQGISNSQSGASGIPSLDRHLSLQRHMLGHLRHEEVRSPTHSVGSHDTNSERSKDKKRVVKERNGGGVLFRSSPARGEMEHFIASGPGVVERIVAKIVSDPIQVTARRIQEMPDQSIAYVKDNVGEMLENEAKLHFWQDVLQRRSDLTPGTLTNCHRVQLEILVAVKTGLRDFLWRTNNISSSDLIEILLNLKCKNIACRSVLPVDECDCKVCAQKNGFCSACMCIVCSKFDMASNTCSWVGCDVCVHWCHTDCALRGFYIKNGKSVTGPHGTTEMQFFCVACNHPSEMFGFVKEVFKTCAKDWKAETLSSELEYVRRIFRASEDTRGKQLHDVATQMLGKLGSKSNLFEAYNCIMAFLSESDSKFTNSPAFSVKEPPLQRNREGSNGVVGPNREPVCLRSVSLDKTPSRMETADGVLPILDWERVGGKQTELLPELQLNTEKKPVMDELDSIVRIKHAEAKMFQGRADDARKESEALKRIAIAKSEKIEEEYTRRMTKLHLAEAEERRKKKLEELQALERAHLEYFNMKVRMEADIKDLMLKMEATKRNLSM